MLGMWNAEVMQAPFCGPAFLEKFTKDTTYASVSWGIAEAYLKRAVASEPTRPIHHLTLGRVHAIRGRVTKPALSLSPHNGVPSRKFNDAAYKVQATGALAALTSL